MTTILGKGSRIKHPKFGVGVVIDASPAAYSITFIQHGTMEIPLQSELEVIDAVSPERDSVSFKAIEKTIAQLLQKWADIQEIVPLGAKWEGGVMLLQPADKSLKAKEIPIESFFHKIVMVRDRLRVMEQRINSSDLSDEEKVNLQQYITRIYGSLTTFNLLFKQDEHQFKGTSGD